jgi:hypothetical protein
MSARSGKPIGPADYNCRMQRAMQQAAVRPSPSALTPHTHKRRETTRSRI